MRLVHALGAGLLAALLAAAFLVATPASAHSTGAGQPRTVVTTDMEQDDLASLIRYLLRSWT